MKLSCSTSKPRIFKKTMATSTLLLERKSRLQPTQTRHTLVLLNPPALAGGGLVLIFMQNMSRILLWFSSLPLQRWHKLLLCGKLSFRKLYVTNTALSLNISYLHPVFWSRLSGSGNPIYFRYIFRASVSDLLLETNLAIKPSL